MKRSVFVLFVLALAGCGDVGPATVVSPDPGVAFSTLEPLGQSPIDIHPGAALPGTRQSLPALKFDYSPVADLVLIDTGSPDEFATVRADVAAGAASLRLGGERYDLLQFHFHTPGEHEIDGDRPPMELHLVHRSSNGTLLVVGVLIEEGTEHRELEEIFEELPHGPGDTRAVDRFNLRRLLPHSAAAFRYSGSLTTPPFTEGVRWVVLAEPIQLSHEQIESFVEIFEEGNSREVQPLGGRTVWTDIGVPGR